jgi:hypothetical protein
MLRRAVDTSACAARNCFPTGLKKRLRESSYDLKQSSWAQQPCCTPLSFLPPPPHHHYSHRRMRAKEGGGEGSGRNEESERQLPFYPTLLRTTRGYTYRGEVLLR